MLKAADWSLNLSKADARSVLYNKLGMGDVHGACLLLPVLREHLGSSRREAGQVF